MFLKLVWVAITLYIFLMTVTVHDNWKKHYPKGKDA